VPSDALGDGVAECENASGTEELGTALSPQQPADAVRQSLHLIRPETLLLNKGVEDREGRRWGGSGLWESIMVT